MTAPRPRARWALAAAAVAAACVLGALGGAEATAADRTVTVPAAAEAVQPVENPCPDGAELCAFSLPAEDGGGAPATPAVPAGNATDDDVMRPVDEPCEGGADLCAMELPSGGGDPATPSEEPATPGEAAEQPAADAPASNSTNPCPDGAEVCHQDGLPGDDKPTEDKPTEEGKPDAEEGKPDEDKPTEEGKPDAEEGKPDAEEGKPDEATVRTEIDVTAMGLGKGVGGRLTPQGKAALKAAFAKTVGIKAEDVAVKVKAYAVSSTVSLDLGVGLAVLNSDQGAEWKAKLRAGYAEALGVAVEDVSIARIAAGGATATRRLLLEELVKVTFKAAVKDSQDVAFMAANAGDAMDLEQGFQKVGLAGGSAAVAAVTKPKVSAEVEFEATSVPAQEKVKTTMALAEQEDPGASFEARVADSLLVEVVETGAGDGGLGPDDDEKKPQPEARMRTGDPAERKEKEAKAKTPAYDSGAGSLRGLVGVVAAFGVAVLL